MSLCAQFLCSEDKSIGFKICPSLNFQQKVLEICHPLPRTYIIGSEANWQLGAPAMCLFSFCFVLSASVSRWSLFYISLYKFTPLKTKQKKIMGLIIKYRKKVSNI